MKETNSILCEKIYVSPRKCRGYILFLKQKLMEKELKLIKNFLKGALIFIALECVLFCILNFTTEHDLFFNKHFNKTVTIQNPYISTDNMEFRMKVLCDDTLIKDIKIKGSDYTKFKFLVNKKVNLKFSSTVVKDYPSPSVYEWLGFIFSLILAFIILFVFAVAIDSWIDS